MKGIFSKAVMFVVVAGVVTPACAINFKSIAQAAKSFGSALQTKVAGFKTSAVEFGARAKNVASAQRTRLQNFATTQRTNAVNFLGAQKTRFAHIQLPKFQMPAMPKIAMPKVQMPSKRAMVVGGVVVPAAAFGGLYGYGAYRAQKQVK